MSLEATGVITEIMKVQKGKSDDGKKWEKQEFLIDTGDKYNPIICFQVFGKQNISDLLASREVDDKVKVKFNLGSKEYEGKYYHNVSAWSIKKVVE